MGVCSLKVLGQAASGREAMGSRCCTMNLGREKRRNHGRDREILLQWRKTERWEAQQDALLKCFKRGKNINAKIFILG